ncbi:MAG: hypothetical protein M1571_08215 [Firmicutes bacterium]|nr:hypothetical protein [Bacillota bacterium]
MANENNLKESIYSQVAQRLNLQMISAFIREGEGVPVLDKRSFEARESHAYSEVETAIKELKLDENTADDILSKVVAYMTTVSDIYFSLGMKAGATLAIKLTDNFETDI